MQSTIFNAKSCDPTFLNHLALGIMMWGGEVVGRDFTVEDTIGKEEEIKRSLGILSTTPKDIKKELIQYKEDRKNNPRMFDSKYRNIKMKNVDTGEIVKVFKNVNELMEHLGFTKSKTYKTLTRKIVVDGYVYATEFKKDDKYVTSTRMFKYYEIENIKTGEKIRCKTGKEASEIMGVHKTYLYHVLKSKKNTVKGWNVKRF